MTEIHKSLEELSIESYRPKLDLGPNEYYKSALQFAKTYYSEDINRILSVDFKKISPAFFFKECIWVVHATGFSAKAVGSFFNRLVEAYGDYRILAEEDIGTSVDRIKQVCNNPQKIKAVHTIARTIHERDSDWEHFRDKFLNTPEKLAVLPYIGKITCYHLGRNIGLLDCVKPDLHLVRLVELWEFENCLSMCKHFQNLSIEIDGINRPLGIIDYILWISCSTFGTIEVKKDGSR